MEKSKSTAALYRAQAKVLQHYTAAAQDIVVYLKWPRRRRENANVLRRYRDTSPRIRALSLVLGECTTALQKHVLTESGL